MSDVQAYSGDIRVKDMEVVVATELDESISLVGMLSTGDWAVSMVSQALGSPLELMQGGVKTWKDS